MHVTKLAEGRPERRAGWGTQCLTDLSWLLDSELGGCEHGAVGRMTIEAGGEQEPHRHPGAEEVAIVLEGDGTALAGGRWLPLRAGELLRAPAGAAHALRAGAEGLDLLVVLSAGSAAAAGWEAGEGSAGPEARLLTGLESDGAGLDELRFTPGGGAHELRRRPGGAEFLVLLAGEGALLAAGGEEVAVGPGDAALLPPGSWHGFRNIGPAEVRAVSGSLAAAFHAPGRELPQPARSGS